MKNESVLLRLSQRLRIALVAAGTVLVLVALFADWVGLSNPSSFGRGQVWLAMAGSSLLVGACLGRRVGDIYTGIARALLGTVVLLVILEAAAFGLGWFSNWHSDGVAQSDFRAALPMYREQVWSDTYWKEFHESDSTRYVPYRIWQRKPFEGETIQINEDSVRYTPGGDCGTTGSYRVFLFGGSTIWGIGSPDWGTVAAFLQAQSARLRAGPVCLMNFGEPGYVSTQEVIYLMSLLQSGTVPDVALFLDGANDTFAAYQSGKAGGHHNLDDTSAIFNGEVAAQNHPLTLWLRSFQFPQLVRSLLQSTVVDNDAELITYRTMGLSADAVGDEVVKVYAHNVRIVEALADAYEFEAYFFLLPVISEGRKHLTEAEAQIMANMDAAFVDLLASAYGRFREGFSGSRFHDLSGVFDDELSQIWIDRTHVGPAGNQLIAEQVLRALTAGVE